jgi:hypothetical protein
MFSHLMMPRQHPDSADIFQLGRAGIPRPLQNILYLLQILSPGLLVVRSPSDNDDSDWANQGTPSFFASDSATRGFPLTPRHPSGVDLVALPPSIWVGLHIEDLEDIFGAQTAVKLYQAAEDPYCSSEDATTTSSISNYGSQDADMYLDDSSYSGFASDYSDEEDWPGSSDDNASPDYYEQDDVLLQQFSQQQRQQEKQVYNFSEVSVLPEYSHHEEYNHPPPVEYNPPNHHHHLISDFDNGKAQNLMEYRHCDSDCKFCGTCSSRFAESLTERLLMHGALLNI